MNFTTYNMLCALGMVLFVCAPLQVSAGSAFGVGQDVLVQFKPHVGQVKQHTMRSKVKVKQLRRFKALGDVQYWQLDTPMDAKKVIQQLQDDPSIAFIEPNYPRTLRALPDDIDFKWQWALHNTGQLVGSQAGTGMHLPSAWDIQTGAANVVVAIVDDSVDINHPDLQANIWTNAGEIANNGIDDDGNGFVDDVHGWDFVDNDNDPSADAGKGEGHGTMVAGCIGAVGNNGMGVSGVSWNVSMMPIKFVPNVAGELEAMNYAVSNGAKIINASWGGPQFSFAESAAMQTLLTNGVLLVAAAGNYHGNNDNVPDYPSGLPYPNILAVSASSPAGGFTSWAHYGATRVDVAAPGETIYTTTTPDTYDYTDGTSFSSPLTAGVAALILAQYPTASYQDIKGRIMGSVDVMGTMNQRGLSATDGRVNAATALRIQPQPVLVLSDITLTDNNNNLVDPNETLNINLGLENVWQATTGVVATLSTVDPLVSVSIATSSWVDLQMGQQAASSTDFVVQLGSFTGYRSIPFVLNITTATGHTFTRYFSLQSGTLLADKVGDIATMRHDQDVFQYFHIDVPAGAALLNVTSKAGIDVDILVKYGNQPLFDYNSYDINSVFGRDSQTHVSASGNTGNEQVLIHAPKAGTWHVVMVSYDLQPGSYKLMASTTSSTALVPIIKQPSASTGPCLQPSGLFSPSSSMLFFAFLLAFKLLVYRKGWRKSG